MEEKFKKISKLVFIWFGISVFAIIILGFLSSRLSFTVPSVLIYLIFIVVLLSAICLFATFIVSMYKSIKSDGLEGAATFIRDFVIMAVILMLVNAVATKGNPNVFMSLAISLLYAIARKSSKYLYNKNGNTKTDNGKAVPGKAVKKEKKNMNSNKNYAINSSYKDTNKYNHLSSSKKNRKK